MSAFDDHLRLTGCDALAGLERARARTGVRARPRTTDWNAVFERAGLVGVIRRR